MTKTKASTISTTKAKTAVNVAQLQSDLAINRAMAENSPINILFANKDLVITYANPASIRTLKSLEKYLPIRAEEVIGQNIDIFHRNPSHQRRLLSNDRNLPHRAIIAIGDQKADLLVSPTYDDKGAYLGPMVTWEVVTEKLKLEDVSRDASEQLAAVGKVTAKIEFNMDGTIVAANENFLKAVGYDLSEIVGKHHRIFCSPEYANSPEYKHFWAKLNRGEFEVGEFMRLSKKGEQVWISATYYPINDAAGKPCKVVKFATDITAAKAAQERERQNQKDLSEKVQQLLTVVNAAAAGDLTREIKFTGEDAMGQLASGIRKMTTDLRLIIGQVVDGSAQFSEGARVISESAQSQAQGAQTQSASVEEMSASIEQLTRSIESVKNNAASANTIASETSRMAEEGGQAVQKSVEAMGRIKSSSEQISEIIQVIGEIASQTNLLALNAAIEAARAGVHGLGFAVVADEVRKLAERSSEAAKEISKLIKESTQRVADGATLSEQTGQALSKIIQGVDSTAKKINEIATATVEQAQNATEVAGAVQQISSVTEQAAASCEEMASSSEELGAQAATLQDLVKKFKTE